MSLYVYITRKANPLEDGGLPIAQNEWEEAAKGLGSFRRNHDSSDSKPQNLQAIAEFAWTAHPEGLGIPFLWNDSQVQVKNPDQPTLVCMSTIAEKLNARVVSETGETFSADGSHAGFEPYSEFYENPKRSFLDRLFRRKNDA